MTRVLERAFPDGMSRAEFASFLRGGHDRKTGSATSTPTSTTTTTAPAVTLTGREGAPQSSINDGWRPPITWQDPIQCGRRNFCIPIRVASPPSDLEIAWKVVRSDTREELVSQRPQRFTGAVDINITPLITDSETNQSPEKYSVQVKIWYITGWDSFIEYRSVGEISTWPFAGYPPIRIVPAGGGLCIYNYLPPKGYSPGSCLP